MAKRSRVYQKLDWNGGVNSTIDSGLLDDRYLTIADNVLFSTTGARIKRQGFSYVDSGVPTATRISSSGTTKTILFTNPDDLATVTAPADSRLVVGETIDVSGHVDVAASAAAILTLTSRAEVTDVVCVADVSGSLNNKYFYLNVVDNDTRYYVWFNVNSGGTDPAIAGRTAVPVAIATGASASTVAAAAQAAIDALGAFSASVSTNTVTVTNAVAGPATDASDAGSTGFTISVTTQGAQLITYIGSTSATLTETATTAVTIVRSAAALAVHDYWYFNSSYVKQQLLMYYTADKKLFKLADGGYRTEIAGKPEVTTITCVADSAGSLNNKYFFLSSANDETLYYVWYNINGAGTDPAIVGRVPIEVTAATNASNTTIATATQAAIDGLADFTASVNSNVVTVTNVTAGAATDAVDVNSTHTIATTTQGATLPTTELETVRMLTFANKLVISFDDVGDYPVIYDPIADAAAYSIMPGAPDASVFREHFSRLFCNDKSEPDRLHYCAPFDLTTWLGNGDSGAIDIGTGDGDERGITTIMPSFKGRLFVAKASKLYQLSGDSPEWYRVDTVSDGIGSLSHSACASIDQDSVLYMSRRGIHSVEATSSYGDFEGAFVSADIQPTFNGWNTAALRHSSATYIPTLNSIAFTIAERGATTTSAIWLYNLSFKSWYRWPRLEAYSITTRLVDSVPQMVFGNGEGRIVSTQNGTYADFGDAPISYRVKTGVIYPDKQIQSMKAFKRLTFFYRPLGAFRFTSLVRVDKAPTQSIAFEQAASGDLLDVNFILGGSVLGTSGEMAPFTVTVDGYGRGVTIEITNDEAAEQVAIYGFAIEYVDADNKQEVV